MYDVTLRQLKPLPSFGEHIAGTTNRLPRAGELFQVWGPQGGSTPRVRLHTVLNPDDLTVTFADVQGTIWRCKVTGYKTRARN